MVKAMEKQQSGGCVKEVCCRERLRNLRPTSFMIVVICLGGNPLRRHTLHTVWSSESKCRGE